MVLQLLLDAKPLSCLVGSGHVGLDGRLVLFFRDRVVLPKGRYYELANVGQI